MVTRPKPPHFPFTFHTRSGRAWASYFRNDDESLTPIRPRFHENEAGFRLRHAEMMQARGKSVRADDSPHSVRAYAERYRRSATYRALAENTRRTYEMRLRFLCEDYGDKSMAKLTERGIARIIDENPRTDVTVNGMLKMLSLLAKIAVRDGILDRNPVPAVDKRRVQTTHYAPWPLDVCERFRARWPMGTQQRLAFEIGFHTGQRISDVAAAQWAHLDGDVWRMVQGKTKRALVLPVWGQLPAALHAAPRVSLFVIGTKRGARPVKSAGNWFRDACDMAAVPAEFSFHGLRATCAVAAVEAGLSEDEAMSLTGHKSASEFRRYVKGARQEVLARSAVAKMENTPRTDGANFSEIANSVSKKSIKAKG